MILRYVYLFYDAGVTLSIGVLSWASCVHGLCAVEGIVILVATTLLY